MPVTALVLGDVRDEVGPFRAHLEAENKSARTIESYIETVDQFLAFLLDESLPTQAEQITNRHVEAWFRHLRETGRSEATVALRFRSLRVFWNWMVAEELVERSPMAKVVQPKVAAAPVAGVSPDDVRALLRTCRTRGFEDVRDRAIIMLYFDLGARLSEIANLKFAECVKPNGYAADEITVVRKGGRTQTLPLAAEIRVELDRYLRLRRVRRDAGLEWLWLGRRHRLQAPGIVQMIRRRAALAGIGHIHIHQFRHGAAQAMLANGVPEGDVARLLGWSDHSARAMLSRYAAANAEERAKISHERWSPRKLLK